MLDPTTLFTWEPHVDQRTVRADVLVVTLGSFLDAGHTQRQVDDHLLQRLPNQVLGRFDTDQLMDYQGRRPLITFDRHTFTDYKAPRIALHQVTDSEGRPFLLLSGPEPSFQWERMAAAVRHVIEQLSVRRTVLVQTMPAPAPHTRPVVVTRYASDPALVESEPVLGTFTLSAPFSGVLTLRLGESGHEVVGLLAHVPHYVADADFPPAASAMVDALRETTQLALPTDGFDLSSALVRKHLDAQVADSEELTALVSQLEEQYDRFAAQYGLPTVADHQLPSAEEIGARFEDFLAGLGGGPADGPPNGEADGPSDTDMEASDDGTPEPPAS